MMAQPRGHEGLSKHVQVLVCVWRYFLGSMNSTSLTFRFIVILSIFTVFNIIFLGVSWNHRYAMQACSVDTIFQGTTKFITMNGKFHLDEALGEPCQKYLPSSETEKMLISAVRSVIKECSMRPKPTPKLLTNPILTLFSSWALTNNTDKDLVHNITLNNWARFIPKINIVLFSNDSRVAKIGQRFGIRTLPILHHAGGGAPVLRTMFQTVKKLYSSSLLYGYANSDILFTSDFIDTLNHVISETNLTVPLFMTGRRTNVENLTPVEAESWESLQKAARTRGSLFLESAEDYFITNAAFPWNKVADVVIGRLAYDNWLVGHARCNLNSVMIELSNTVLAVHQTTTAGGNFEGFKHPNAHYNEEVLKTDGTEPNYNNGFTICIQSFTYYSFCGDILIGKRDSFWTKCECATIPQRTLPATHSPNSSKNR